jgi:hypothetical protein
LFPIPNFFLVFFFWGLIKSYILGRIPADSFNYRRTVVVGFLVVVVLLLLGFGVVLVVVFVIGSGLDVVLVFGFGLTVNTNGDPVTAGPKLPVFVKRLTVALYFPPAVAAVRNFTVMVVLLRPSLPKMYVLGVTKVINVLLKVTLTRQEASVAEVPHFGTALGLK